MTAISEEPAPGRPPKARKAVLLITACVEPSSVSMTNSKSSIDAMRVFRLFVLACANGLLSRHPKERSRTFRCPRDRAIYSSRTGRTQGEGLVEVVVAQPPSFTRRPISYPLGILAITAGANPPGAVGARAS